MKIERYEVRKVLNSKGEKTIEVCINGFCSSPPSGTSTSEKEFPVWPEGGVEEAIRRVKEVLKGMREVDDPLEWERGNLHLKEHLGGNGLLSITISLIKAFSNGCPALYFGKASFTSVVGNVIGGGKHGGGSDVQEFLLITEPSPEGIFHLSKAYRELRSVLKKKDRTFSGALTIESAYVTSLNVEDVLSILSSVAEEYGMKTGMDMAASSLFKDNVYVYEKEGIVRDRNEQIEYVKYLVDTYGVFYVEDPLEENDYEGFRELSNRTNAFIVGDDLFATNVKYFKPVTRGAIVKYNQVGSISETLDFMEEIRKHCVKPVVSHRSGETEDTFLSHFAVGTGSPYIKPGVAGIRTVKLNELLRIYDRCFQQP